MPLRLGFADTLSGQLHFRACGAGPDIVLLPWLPVERPHVRTRSCRTWRARDFAPSPSISPASGRSHKNCRNWTVQQYAADVLEACGSLHTVPYTVIGGRFGAVGGGRNVVSLAGAGDRRRARWRSRASRPKSCAR